MFVLLLLSLLLISSCLNATTSTIIGLYGNTFEYSCSPSQGMFFDTDLITHPSITKTTGFIPGTNPSEVSIFTVDLATLYKVTIQFQTDTFDGGVSVIYGPDILTLTETIYFGGTHNTFTLGSAQFIINATSPNFLIIGACANGNSNVVNIIPCETYSSQSGMSNIMIESVA